MEGHKCPWLTDIGLQLSSNEPEIHDFKFLSAVYLSVRKFLVDGMSLLSSVSWKELHRMHVSGSFSSQGSAFLRGRC